MSFASLLLRATAFHERFFGCAETAPVSLPALSAKTGFAQRLCLRPLGRRSQAHSANRGRLFGQGYKENFA
jgi:hypothetical protein